jgi:mycoredoxin
MSNDAKIMFYSTNWCPACRRAKKLMTEIGIHFEEINIDRDKDASEYVIKVNNGYRSVPTIIFPDGDILVEPSNRQLEKKLGEIDTEN